MQLLTQYELSCILVGSLHIYYQYLVCAFTKYGAVQIEQQEIKNGSEANLKAGMLFGIFLVLIALQLKGDHLCLLLGYLNYFRCT